MIKYKIKSTVGQLGDFAKEWWTDEDHANWEAKVKHWKETGEYGTPFTIEMSLIENPLYDSRFLTSSLSSARMGILDFSNLLHFAA